MKALLVGESWTSYSLHQKGFNAYTTGEFETAGGEFVSALEHNSWQVTRVLCHEVATSFPSTLPELGKYDLVVLSDVGADTFQLHPETLAGQRRADPLRLLADFVVAEGGGLLMIGGYMSFTGFEGRARYSMTPLADVLPVRLAPADDRVELPEGVAPRVCAAHEVLEGLPPDWPWLLGYNRVAAKEDADTLVEIASDPLLVVGACGAGRVGAFTSDLAPHWGSPAFMTWSGYERFWGQLASWLVNPAA